MLWQEHGGSGRTPHPLRGRKGVLPTLTEIAARENLVWPKGLYRSTSAAIHMFGTDFLLESVAGTTAVVWANQAQRCSWLTWATACFEHLSRTAVGLMGGDDVEEMQTVFNDAARAILTDPIVLAARQTTRLASPQ